MRDVAQLTAAVLIIGDEILSGRTQDSNLAVIARFLTPLGIDLKEARVVPDVEIEIIAAVNALRQRYTYVFTTGGIGPTHDDITADAIGVAFGLPVEHDDTAMEILAARYRPGEFNERRQRMARMPKGATVIRNRISAAPGFQIGNVFVLAGVPKIMEVMLDDVRPRLQQAIPVISLSLKVPLAEGQIADGLEAIQNAHPGLRIGSYPFFTVPGMPGSTGTTLVIRGRNNAEVDIAADEIVTLIKSFGVIATAVE
jgi:molybdenum cofactor synthesis domain-containing protein